MRDIIDAKDVGETCAWFEDTYKVSRTRTCKTIMVGKSQPQHPEIIDIKIVKWKKPLFRC